MRTQKKTIKYYSSIFFNLFALAVLLTAIVVVHQILKKPSTKEETATVKNVTIKSIPALPEKKTTEQVTPTTPQEKMAIVELETKPEVKKPKTKTIKWKKVKKRARRKYSKSTYKSRWAQGPSVEELDNETTRQRYLKENNQLSEGVKVEAAPTYTTYHYETPSYVGSSRLPPAQAPIGSSIDELDNESARQYYLEQNKRKAGDLAYKPKPSKNTAKPASYTTTSYEGPDDYIPFERK